MKLMIFTGFVFLLAGLFIGGLMQACKKPMPEHTTDFPEEKPTNIIPFKKD